ncbi:uncharacterized protein LOC132195670 [Neocloeon triangulifer]|uniref:uncharacterized protein LOC132195670 n=1 Tax=Neocloeon triangulifer TaxID=2078957 RepID=UPI00286F2D0F|nr:uncharacterized protein LOC132195670 [Neocloeon triangulifer]
MEKSCSREGIVGVTVEEGGGEGRASFCERVGDALNILWIVVAFSLLAFALTVFFCHLSGCQAEFSSEGSALAFGRTAHAPGVRRLAAAELRPDEDETLSGCRPLTDALYQLVCNQQTLCRAALGPLADDAPLLVAPANYSIQFECKDGTTRVLHALVQHHVQCRCALLAAPNQNADA